MLAAEIAWPSAAGIATLLLALVAGRKDPWSALGRACFSAPLAVFGAEHLVSAQDIVQIVPAWMPARLFWTYFVGLALISAALRIASVVRARLAGLLLGCMFVLFVFLIHVPNLVADPGNRILWAVAFRETAFAGGAWSLASGTPRQRRLTRVCVAVPLILFATEHFLHPAFVPGVPLGKVMPSSIPLRALWGNLTGVAELAAGTCLLLNRHARTAANWLALLLIALVLFLYPPVFIPAPPAKQTEAMNYIADTLLFAGAVRACGSRLWYPYPVSSP